MGDRDPGPPCSLCQPVSMGYGLCAKIKFGGLTGHGVEGLVESPVDISPPNLGTPSEQAERGITKQDLLWLQTQVSGQHRCWCWEKWGSRPGQQWDLAENQFEPQEKRLWDLLGLGLGPPGRGRGSGLSPKALRKRWQERMAT